MALSETHQRRQLPRQRNGAHSPTPGFAEAGGERVPKILHGGRQRGQPGGGTLLCLLRQCADRREVRLRLAAHRAGGVESQDLDRGGAEVDPQCQIEFW